MLRIGFLIAVMAFALTVSAQEKNEKKEDNSWKTLYRSVPEKAHDLIHTRLDASFNYSKSQLNGKVWLTLKPHFYATDSLRLDAKGMDIQKVQIAGVEKNIPVKYSYDGQVLSIHLGKKYSAKEKYTVYIEYTAKPNDYKGKGSAAITDAKGLYFINPDGSDKEKPTQIWTQGETEGTSVWIPTLDKPNQKSTQEMNLTVPDKYVTLSNGAMTKQKKNADGTRTDTWKMDLPHAPYLFFMGVGNYSIVKDSYKGKEVSYYVEPEYKGVARKIFGDTPEMMKFFSQTLGVEYPWNKYAQMTARDYVSGAMENTTATLHGDFAQQNARQLVDGNVWESTIAHELFHQWFGDLVTCESWSNLTVNESFADFSERIWLAHKYGKEEGDAHNHATMRSYLASRSADKTLVRYYYADKEHMFDAVSYAKGGTILYMLKNFVGEEAFYQSLKTYLNKNRFGNGDARKLQQAFEETTGQDMNWFFNQWYYGAGHPQLEISYGYDATGKKATVYVKQLQSSLFKLPVTIDVYQNEKPVRYSRWIEHAADTFSFEAAVKPDLINVDADKVLLTTKKDNKSISEFIFQYRNFRNYVDRWEAIDYAAAHPELPEAIQFLQGALKDPHYRLRIKTLRAFRTMPVPVAVLTDVESLIKTDPDQRVVADAVALLGSQKNPAYKDLFISHLKDSSYSVAGAAYSALIDIDETNALTLLPELKKDARGTLKTAVSKADLLSKTDADFEEQYKDFSSAPLNAKYTRMSNFILYLSRINDTSNFKKGMEQVVATRDQILAYIGTYKEDVNRELTKAKAVKELKKTKGIPAKDMDAQIAIIDEAMKK